LKFVARLILWAGFGVALIFAWHGHRAENIVAAEQHAPVMVTRLYTGADNLSHVEQVEVNFLPVARAPGSAGQSESVKASHAYVVRLAPGFFEDWHNADARRYVVPIRGRAEIEIAGGQKSMVEPGHIYLAEDLTGKGHTFRVVGTEDWVAVFVDFAK
jgi:hypothetical protein